MATAATAQGDTALRNEEPRPTLSTVRLGGFSPFTHIDEPGNSVGQAYALLQLLAGSYRDCDAIGPGIEVGPKKLTHTSLLYEVRGNLVAEALDGISTLLGLEQHSIELDRFLRSQGRRS